MTRSGGHQCRHVWTAVFETTLFPQAFEARSRSSNAASSASFSVMWPATAPHHCSNSLVSMNFAEAFSAGFLRDLRKVERDEDGRPKARYVPALNEMRLRLDLTRNQPNAAATMAPLNVAKPPVDNRHPGI
jgi:hypothetical protein